jgi:hypothetical protein
MAMNRVGPVVGVLAGLLCNAPAPPLIRTDADMAKAELLALHQADRRAHFHHDVNALLATVPADFIYVRDGRVQAQTKEDLRKRFTGYFQGAEFTAWDDLEPPIIHASPDGQMGWMVVRVKIAYSKAGAAGNKTLEQSVIAWMSVYERHEGQWLHVANTSTFEPEEGNSR